MFPLTRDSTSMDLCVLICRMRQWHQVFFKVPFLTEFLRISDSVNHGRWFFGKLKQMEQRRGEPYKAILPEAENLHLNL